METWSIDARWLRVLALALLLYLPACGEEHTEAGAGMLGNASGSEPMEQGNVLARAAGVELGAGPTRVALGGGDVAARLAALGSRRVHLVIRGLRAANPPGVLYYAFLGLPAGAVPADEDPRHVGILNFYAAQTGPVDPDRIFYSFDATDAVRTLRARGELRDSVTVTFYPVGNLEPGAKPVISRVELVEE